MQGFVQDDEDPRCLAPRLRAVEAKLEAGDAKEADLYVCELRRIKSIKQPPPFPVPHPCALLGARKTKTLRKKQVADALGIWRGGRCPGTRRTTGCLSGVEARARVYTSTRSCGRTWGTIILDTNYWRRGLLAHIY